MKVAGVGRLDCRVNQTIAGGNLSQGNSPQVLVCQPGSQWVIWHLNGGARVDGEEACHRCIGEIGPAGSRGLEQVRCECGGAARGGGGRPHQCPALPAAPQSACATRLGHRKNPPG